MGNGWNDSKIDKNYSLDNKEILNFYRYMSQKDQGSFLTGFSLGLFAGAFGYLLFGTDRGKKIRTDLSQEWDQAKDKLAQDGIINDPDASLRDVVHEFAAKIWGSQKAEKIVPSSKNHRPPSFAGCYARTRSRGMEAKNLSSLAGGQKSKVKNKKTTTLANKFKGT